MKIKVELNDQSYEADLHKPLDISIPLSPAGPRAWYVDPLKIEPVRTERFTGSVAEGGDVNFRNISFNPHGHGTHTESVGHIDQAVTSVNQSLTQYFFSALLVTIEPLPFENTAKKYGEPGDKIIIKDQVEKVLGDHNCAAFVMRSLPNGKEKKSKNYAGTNPPFLEPEALTFLRNRKVKHLLLDLPSVDREEDSGELLAHHAFWMGDREDDKHCTITEMIYVSDEIEDGLYLLNLQTAPFENDATPSRPVLFKLNS
jgi:kynurenine formamidase